MDINCDLGEGLKNDYRLMPYLDSCNIACGGHAGDKETMIKTLRLAGKYGVKAGAHPSFEDRKNFGRKEVSVPMEVLKTQLIQQIGLLYELTKAENMSLHHVKAHGALYNMAWNSNEIATVIIEAVQFFKEKLCIYGPFDSALERKAKEAGIPFMIEIFADRNYEDDFRLVSRMKPKAIITDPDEVRKRMEKIISEGALISLHGKKRSINFDTLCVHGDHPHAVKIVKELRDLKRELY